MQQELQSPADLQNPYIKHALENPKPEGIKQHYIPMVPTPEPYEPGRYCLECGKLLPERTRPNGRKRLFCSEAHKKAFNRRLQKRLKEETKDDFGYWITPAQIEELTKHLDEAKSQELIRQMAYLHGYAAGDLALYIVLSEKIPLIKTLIKKDREITKLKNELSTAQRELEKLKLGV